MGTNPDPLLHIPHLYHFTDVTNLPSIRRLGGLYATARLREMGEGFCAGGDEDSLSLDSRCGMDGYVHLCFATGHPMAGRITQRKADANLIYLRIDRTILYQPGAMFATGVGYANGAETVALQTRERRAIEEPPNSRNTRAKRKRTSRHYMRRRRRLGSSDYLKYPQNPISSADNTFRLTRDKQSDAASVDIEFNPYRSINRPIIAVSEPIEASSDRAISTLSCQPWLTLSSSCFT